MAGAARAVVLGRRCIARRQHAAAALCAAAQPDRPRPCAGAAVRATVGPGQARTDAAAAHRRGRLRPRVAELAARRSEEHTSELQSPYESVCRPPPEKKT